MSVESEEDKTDLPINSDLDILRLKNFMKDTEHEYLTTHEVLCFAIIERIYRRILLGYRFGSIKINNNELVVDGNHRYIAYKLAGVSIDVVKGGRSFSDVVKSFNDVKIDEDQDWDLNCFKNKKYCKDDFLSECEKVS